MILTAKANIDISLETVPNVLLGCSIFAKYNSMVNKFE